MIEGIRFSELEGIQELKGTEMIPVVDGNVNKMVKAEKLATKKDLQVVSDKLGNIDSILDEINLGNAPINEALDKINRKVVE